MMGDEHPVAFFKLLYALPCFFNYPGHLVSQNAWSLLDPVPFKHIRSTDTASLHFHQNFTTGYAWLWPVFDPYIVIVVVNGDFHIKNFFIYSVISPAPSLKKRGLDFFGESIQVLTPPFIKGGRRGITNS